MTEATEKKPGRPAKIECEVIKAIGMEVSTEEKTEKDHNGRLMYPDGTKMVFPSKSGDPTTVKLTRDAAKKLQDAGAVRVAI